VTGAKVTYTPHPGATREAELRTLSNVYRFILDCHAKKKAAPASRPDDAKLIKSVRAKSIIPDRP
jgi:hypothetical protein